MASPYAAPAAPLTGEPLSLRALRWRAVLTFIAVPLLLMFVVQGGKVLFVYKLQGDVWRLGLWQPLMIFLPLALLMAATGSAAARACVVLPLGRVVLLAGGLGLLWAAAMFGESALSRHLVGVRPYGVEQLTVMFAVMALLFTVLAIVLCLLTRRHGKRLGFLDAAGAPARKR